VGLLQRRPSLIWRSSVVAGACPASEPGWSSRGSGSGSDLEDLGQRKRGHSGHGDSEVLRAGQGREEANIHVEGRSIYR